MNFPFKTTSYSLTHEVAVDHPEELKVLLPQVDLDATAEPFNPRTWADLAEEFIGKFPQRRRWIVEESVYTDIDGETGEVIITGRKVFYLGVHALDHEDWGEQVTPDGIEEPIRERGLDTFA